MPSAHSPSRSTNADSSRSRTGRKETWPTAGTLLFTGADLEDAVAAAVEELGDDVEVKAARSVKQGLRGKTHVEVLVARPEDSVRPSVVVRPPLPPSERPLSERPSSEQSPAGEPTRRPMRTRSEGEDPVESTLAALLASAEAEEDEYRRAATADAERSSVVPFDPPHLAGNPTFAAEFAAAFPAALAAAKAADPERPARAERSARRPAVDADFTARVRDALRRVPQEDEPAASEHTFSHSDRHWDSADTDELEIIRPAATVLPHVSRPAVVPAAQLQPAHPAPELIDEPPAQPVPTRPRIHAVEQPATAQPVAQPAAQPMGQPAAQPMSDRPSPDGARRSRPSPGPLAMTGRPASLRRPAGTGWSVARLRDLGLPEAVLAALPADEPTDDLRWLVALTDAITATVPAPVEEGHADVTASGTGLRGALALLRLGVDGVPPQTLTVEGRPVPATATELALAVRAGILR